MSGAGGKGGGKGGVQRAGRSMRSDEVGRAFALENHGDPLPAGSVSSSDTIKTRVDPAAAPDSKRICYISGGAESPAPVNGKVGPPVGVLLRIAWPSHPWVDSCRELLRYLQDEGTTDDAIPILRESSKRAGGR